MNLQLTTATGKASKKTVEVSDAAFAREYNGALVHQVVTAYLAGARSGTRGSKSRADVRGGGAKPWRQKGTGRARAGTSNSPIWRGGGMSFALKPQNHSQKVNKKMYRNGVRAIMSELVRQERLVVVESLDLEAPKTKELVDKLKALGLDDVLIVVPQVDEKLGLASRNLFKVGVCTPTDLSPVALVGSDKVLMTVDAVKQLEGILS
ncbi:MAG: 50S ribosomal protein L4 [Gammaproteobacteria bacterium]|nr:50S ribosomal protein L4 [Gammaproteobacteria bacterium]MDH5800542.1 50S ribosomal protein L4 [Gammaproteobacteria bacterium]